jgi:hypothetical protein
VLFRLAYLGVTDALAMLRLLPMSDRAKDAEILALRHQIMVLERQLHGQKVRFTPADRAFLAALLHRLPRDVLHRIRLLVRPETVPRWHRDLNARRGFSRIPFRLAHRARPIRQCWAITALSRPLPPSPATPGSAASSFNLPLRRQIDEGLSPPSGQTAPRGALEEITGQHGRRLRAQELPPGGVVTGTGTGGIPQRLRIRRMVEAPIWWPRPSSSPWMRW